MLTLYTCPKSFTASPHIALIQRNALQSWKRLTPQPQIILMGDDAGVGQAAQDFGCEYVPEIGRNEYGTPLVSDIFAQAQKHAKHEVVCYINADMIIGDDFAAALDFVAAQARPFLMVSQRWNLDITTPLDFDAPDWNQTWPRWVKQNGRLDGFAAIDFFAYSSRLYDNVPPFAIGRTLWDNWLLFEARRRRAILVDATPVVTLAHQNHDYAHVISQPGDAYKGPERDRNAALMGDVTRIFTIENATHRLFEAPQGLELRSTLSQKSQGQIIRELAATNASLRAVGKAAAALSIARRRLMARGG